MFPILRHLKRAVILAMWGSTALAPKKSFAQRPPEQPEASRILHSMEKLPVVGSVLYVAAHPDDENTKLIAWLSNGAKVRTGYLSLTRGDGGQNLIGTELGDGLGIIRTEELLAARRIDGGEQFFTRASDFGYSKTPEESFAKWGHQEVLSDVVRVIRMFRPDVIITRFSEQPGPTHGHHTASAILAHEAFDLAGDPKAFPEQIAEGLQPWQPRRLYFNGSTWWNKNLDQIAKTDKDWYAVDVGGYDPLLGLSYTEIAGRSRSMHKSQGFGAAETRGEQLEYLHFEKGDRPKGDQFLEGIDMTWSRVKGSEAVNKSVTALLAGYDQVHPEKSVAELERLATAVDALPASDWKDFTRNRVNQLLLNVTGTVVEALAKAPYVVTMDSIQVNLDLLTRSSASVRFEGGSGTETLTKNVVRSIPVGLKAPLSPDQPFWLARPHGSLFDIEDPKLIGLPITPARLQVPYTLRFAGGTEVKGTVPVYYRTVDRVKGELVQNCEVVPPVSLFASPSVLIVKDTAAIEGFGVEAYTDLAKADLICELVADWNLRPSQQELGAMKSGERKGAAITVAPRGAKHPTEPYLRMAVGHAGPTNLTRRIIDYDHIPTRSWYTPATFRAVPLDVKVDAKRVGYVMGAGDNVPQATEALGVTVDMIDPSIAKLEDLKQYDAIVTGIRAYNATKGMKELHPLLIQYVKEGGTLVVQYNTTPRSFTGDTDFQIDPATLGPYPFNISRDRVTVEEAAPSFPNPENPLLNTPNKITKADFEGWVQERGLYFAGDIDAHYTPVISWNDPGEKTMDGALISCDFGKGRFIYTGISFFRQLPAGVPGAYRLWANLISKREKGK